MKKEVEKCLKDIKKGLSRSNELSDETIENFEKTLYQLGNINMIKEGGFSQYIKVESPEELVEMVSKTVNDVVKTFKNINIGDMQWILFFEKILKLADHLPAYFEPLKIAALQQYQECAKQVLTDFNQIFINNSFLVRF
jgi:hypothetical protein